MGSTEGAVAGGAAVVVVDAVAAACRSASADSAVSYL